MNLLASVFFVAFLAQAPVAKLPDWFGKLGLALSIAILIVALGFVAVVFQLVSLFRYKRARHHIDAIYDKLEGKGTVGLDNVRQAATEVLGSHLDDRKDLVGRFLHRAIRRGAAFRTGPAIETALQQENESLRTAFPRWVIGSALILGLCGTFAAFMQLVSGSGVLDALSTLRTSAHAQNNAASLATSYDKLSTAFSSVYEGFSYAFFASLAGLLTTAGLGFVQSLAVSRAKHNCYARLEELADEVLQPLLAPSADPSQELSRALLTTTSVMKDVQPSVTSFQEAAALLSTAANRFEETQGVNSKMMETLSDLADELKTSREGWDILLEALRESRTSMKVSVEDFKNEAAAQRKQTDSVTAAAVAGMRDVVATLSGEVQKISAAKLEHLQGVQDSVRAMVENSKNAWQESSTAILSQTSEAFKTSLAKVTEVITDSRGDAAAARDDIVKLTSQATAVVKSHQSVLEEHAAAVSASLNEWGDAPAELKPMLKALSMNLDKLNTALGSVAALPERWEQRVLRPMASLGGKLDAAETRASLRKRITSPFHRVARYFKRNSDVATSA